MSAHRINVLMVTDALALGGAEQVAVDLANALDRRTHRVHFCATRAGGPLADRLADDIELTVLGRQTTWDLAGIVRFARLVNRSEIDVIHSHGRGTMRFVALVRALGLISARHVFHDHFGWLNLDRSAGLDVRTALRRGVDAYLGVDARLCSWACDTAEMDPTRTFLLRSGVDLTRFVEAEPHDLRGQHDIGADEVLVVMLANMRHPKDHPTLFRAIAELDEAVQDRLRLVVVGATDVDRGYHDGCLAMIARLGIERCVVIHGPSADPAALLAGADAAVLSSKNETGPLVVLEYMASGLPFVATDTGEITHSVRHSGAGFVPPPRDHHALAAALDALVALTPEERRAMGQRGRQLVATVYDLRIVVRSVQQVYELVLGLRDRTDLLPSQAEALANGTRPRPRPQ